MIRHLPVLLKPSSYRKPHKWTEELRIGQWNGYYMEHCGSGTPQPVNKFKMANRRMKLQEAQLPFRMAQSWSVLIFPLQKFLYRKVRFFFYEIKLLFTFFAEHYSNCSTHTILVITHLYLRITTRGDQALCKLLAGDNSELRWIIIPRILPGVFLWTRLLLEVLVRWVLR